MAKMAIGSTGKSPASSVTFSFLTCGRSDANEGVCIDVNYINNPPKDRKRDITSVFGEPEVLDKTEKKEVKITFGNAVPPQPKEKREVKVTYSNAVPPQPAEKRGSRFAV